MITKFLQGYNDDVDDKDEQKATVLSLSLICKEVF